MREQHKRVRVVAKTPISSTGHERDKRTSPLWVPKTDGFAVDIISPSVRAINAAALVRAGSHADVSEHVSATRHCEIAVEHAKGLLVRICRIDRATPDVADRAAVVGQDEQNGRRRSTSHGRTNGRDRTRLPATDDDDDGIFLLSRRSPAVPTTIYDVRVRRDGRPIDFRSFVRRRPAECFALRSPNARGPWPTFRRGDTVFFF